MPHCGVWINVLKSHVLGLNINICLSMGVVFGGYSNVLYLDQMGKTLLIKVSGSYSEVLQDYKNRTMKGSVICGLMLLSLVIQDRVVGGLEHKAYDYTKYHTMEEISAWMSQIERDNPDIVSSITYGQTYEKRNITLLKIGYKSTTPKKVVWMDCGIHAREWITPAFCQHFVKEILGSYKTDSKMDLLFKNLDFYITPVLNMDGYIYSWKDNTTRLWRKSRSPGTGDCKCFGTDINSNFYATWGMVGVSSNCCSVAYRGPNAVSEPETRAVTEFLEAHKNEILCFLTIHSFGQLILVPYGHPNISAPNYNELMEVGLAAAKAIKAVYGEDYKVGTPPDVLYSNSGSSRDFARLIGIPYSFTFELRDKGEYGFILPEVEIQPTCQEAYQGAMSIINYVHDKTFTSAASTVDNTGGFMDVKH